MSGTILRSMASKAWVDTYTKGYVSGDHRWRELCASDKADNISELCSGFQHAKIVEVGAGDGAILKQLIRRKFGREWHALEISPTALSYMASHTPEVRGALYDGISAPFPDNAFDLVILSHVVEHVENPRQFVSEMARIGKYLFIEVPLEDTLRLSPDYVFDELGHINYYSVSTIRRLVQTCGLRIESGVFTHSSLPVYQYRLGKLKGLAAYSIKEAIRPFPRLARALWTYHYALVAA